MYISSEPCLSLWQPWASMLVAGPKVHETRSWAPPRKLLGRRFLIHAAKGGAFNAPPEQRDELRRLTIARLGTDDLPLGAVVGSARLVDVYPTDLEGWIDEDDRALGFWTPGRFAWRFDEREILEEPIPLRGQRGIWYVDRAFL